MSLHGAALTVRGHAAERKGFYDLHGEVALKSGMPDGSGGTKGGSYAFTSDQCDEIFRAFFGTDNPFAALEGAHLRYSAKRHVAF